MKDNIINKSIDTNTTSLIICPDCKIRIPLLSFISSSEILIKCLCNKKVTKISLNQYLNKISQINNTAQLHKCNKHSVHSAQYYCTKCLKWLCKDCYIDINNTEGHKGNGHIIIHQFIQLHCFQHKMPYLYYCYYCQVNICFHCRYSHQNHMHKILHHIDIHKIKEDTKLANLILKSTNEDIKKLHLNIWKTLDELNTFSSFELIKLEQSILIRDILKGEGYDNTEGEEGLFGNLIRDKEDFDGDSEVFLDFSSPLQIKELVKVVRFNNFAKCMAELNNCRLALSLFDINILLWDLTTNKLSDTLKGHSSYVNRLVNIKATNILASSSGDKTIRLWNTITNKCIKILDANEERLHDIIELKDGTLAAGSYNNIQIWNTITYQRIAILFQPKISICSLTELKDGRIAYGTYDKSIGIWDRNSTLNDNIVTLLGHGDQVSCLIQLRDGRLASCSYDSTIRLWNLITNQCITVVTVSKQIVFHLIEIQNGRLAIGSNEKYVKLVNTTTFECTTILVGHTHKINCFSELKDGRLVSGSDDNTIRLWDNFLLV